MEQPEIDGRSAGSSPASGDPLGGDRLVWVRLGEARRGEAGYGRVWLGAQWAIHKEQISMIESMFELRGTMPLLMHADDVMAADRLMAWRKDPKNKSVSVPGDDRSPAWSWQTYVYSDGTHLALPQECLMAALRYAGTKIPLSKGKGTYKAMSQSGLLIGSDFCEFRNDGEQIAIADIHAFRDEPFAGHVSGARDLGFDLMIKRAKVGSSKHVRVRPKFSAWTVSGTIAVSEPAITPDVLNSMFEIAGRLAGLCDWRPSSPDKPGPYGMFTAEVKPLKAGRKAG
jgi:hypothetical protein